MLCLPPHKEKLGKDGEIYLQHLDMGNSKNLLEAKTSVQQGDNAQSVEMNVTILPSKSYL